MTHSYPSTFVPPLLKKRSVYAGLWVLLVEVLTLPSRLPYPYIFFVNLLNIHKVYGY